MKYNDFLKSLKSEINIIMNCINIEVCNLDLKEKK